MKRYISDLYALCSEPVHQLIGKVEPRRGSGSRAELVAVNGLVTLAVLKLLGDVGGKRHLSDLVKRREEVFVAVKVDYPVAVVLYFDHRCRQKSFAEGEFCAFLCLSAGLAEGLPTVARYLLEQKELDPCAGVLNSVDPRGQYP